MTQHKLILVFIASIFATMSCLCAWADDFPPGTYRHNTPPMHFGEGCQPTRMDHGTLYASCVNFFGAMQNTSLSDADKCVADKHDIWDVNGNLRCVLSSLPIGGSYAYTADIISISRDDKNDVEETKVWRIDQPRVDFTPSDYRAISFKPGDMISVTAGGCVQTGGSGSTWKSYTNPLGDNADHLYSGTINIPGVTEGGLQRIGGQLAPKELLVPLDLPPTVLSQLHLQLGYQDDQLSDNGYYAHDNGNDNQCANVGPAWVEIRVVSDLRGLPHEPKYTPHQKPFDIAWDMANGVDANGLPLNPKWGSQIDQSGPSWQSKPAFQPTCGSAFSTGSWPTDSASEDVGKLAATCTTQQPTEDLSQNDFDMFFTICRSDLFPGHLNWSIGTYQGAISWQEYSGGWPNDGDYNFGLYPPDNAGMTSNENGLGLEFKGGETVDYFGNPWWNNTLSDDTRAATAINGHPAVVVGLIGIDGVHNGGYTESHPVFAMAIQLSQSESDTAIDESWVYFIRNVGNEGECSHMEHYWPGLAGAYYMPFPWPSSDVRDVTFLNSQFWKDDSSNIAASHGVYPGWSYLKFQFPNVDAGDVSTIPQLYEYAGAFGMVDGVVSLHYTKHAGTPRRSVAPHRDYPRVHPEDEPKLDEIAARISDPAIRKQFEDDVRKADPTVKINHPKRVVVEVDSAVKNHYPPLAAGHRGELTHARPLSDPKKQASQTATKMLVDKYQKYFPKPEPSH
jgi:hypothetical protein